MKISMIIVVVSLGYVSANCTTSFIQLNETIQDCLGSNLLLQCCAEGNGSTVFQGNLFNCSSSDDQIALLHSRFNTINGRANGTCNNNKIHGYSLSVDTSSNCYISQLNITVSQDMIGKTIQCVYDDGTTTKEVGNFSIEETQCYTRTVMTVSPTTVTSLSIQTVVTTIYENSTGTSAYTSTHYKGIKSLSTGEAAAITLCCSAFIVGIMITIIILLTFRFKKQLQAIQTSNSVHTIQDNPTSTSNATNLRQQTQATFHHAQNDEVSGYTLCTTDYDRIVIVNDAYDSEYSHLQLPGPQHTPGMTPRAHLQLTYM